jgi:hypothetical protein
MIELYGISVFEFVGLITLPFTLAVFIFTIKWQRWYMAHVDKQEVLANVKDVEKLTAIDWKPGTVLWLRVGYMDPKAIREQYQILERFFIESGVEKPALLVTPSDVEMEAINIVDLLALVGKTVPDDAFTRGEP